MLTVIGFNTADRTSLITASPIVAEKRRVCLAQMLALSTIFITESHSFVHNGVSYLSQLNFHLQVEHSVCLVKDKI